MKPMDGRLTGTEFDMDGYLQMLEETLLKRAMDNMEEDDE